MQHFIQVNRLVKIRTRKWGVVTEKHPVASFPYNDRDQMGRCNCYKLASAIFDTKTHEFISAVRHA